MTHPCGVRLHWQRISLPPSKLKYKVYNNTFAKVT